MKNMNDFLNFRQDVFRYLKPNIESGDEFRPKILTRNLANVGERFQ